MPITAHIEASGDLRYVKEQDRYVHQEEADTLPLDLRRNAGFNLSREDLRLHEVVKRDHLPTHAQRYGPTGYHGKAKIIQRFGRRILAISNRPIVTLLVMGKGLNGDTIVVGTRCADLRIPGIGDRVPSSRFQYVGKSTLAAFLCERLDALILTAADEADILNAIHNDFVTNGRKGRLIYIMDIPRAAGATAPYQTIEKLLSGRLVNTKYVGDNMYIDPCLVVVLANQPPDREGTWSKDRLNTNDKTSTVVDLAGVETECDERRASTKHCGRGPDHDVASFEFCRDAANLPKDELERLPCQGRSGCRRCSGRRRRRRRRR